VLDARPEVEDGDTSPVNVTYGNTKVGGGTVVAAFMLETLAVLSARPGATMLKVGESKQSEPKVLTGPGHISKKNTFAVHVSVRSELL